jgi:hypothetical protein
MNDPTRGRWLLAGAAVLVQLALGLVAVSILLPATTRPMAARKSAPATPDVAPGSIIS